jgi:site-specific DNA-methyltransferase (adenine-specific)
VARKPISEKTIAENVMKWGTGGLNIDGCRIPAGENELKPTVRGAGVHKTGNERLTGWNRDDYDGTYTPNEAGRFPANVILDEEAGKLLDEQSGISKSTGGSGEKSKGALGKNVYGKYSLNIKASNAGGLGDSGGASRFFYCAKASKKERGDSKHPTVKPLSLMRYLCRLVTPPEGIVLDPFAGSGTTLEAAILEGFNVVGIEKEHDYIPDIRRRIERAQLNTQAMDMGLFLFFEPESTCHWRISGG